MLTRRFCSFYYDVLNGFGNGSIIQIIKIFFTFRIYNALTPLLLFLLVGLTVIIFTTVAHPSFAQLLTQKEKITLTVIFVQLDNNREMGKPLLESALTKLKTMYPNFDIQLKYLEYPSNQIRFQTLKALNGTTVSESTDLISLDQIWLGEFAQKGLD